MRIPRVLGAVLASVGLLAILFLTLRPNPQQQGIADSTPLLCIVCGESGGADVFLNLLLFLPLAVGLGLLGCRWGRVVAFCALLSLAVESLQYYSQTGRDASLSDLITNTTSGALGAAIGSRLGRLLLPTPEAARRLSRAGAAAWVGLLLFTGLSMRPWAPAGPLRNYCSAAFPTSEIFAGTARTMILNDVPLSCDADVPHSPALKQELRRGVVRLETVAEAAPPGPRKVIHLVRAPGATLVILAQQGRAAVFQVPTLARPWRLFAPVVRLSGAFPAQTAGPVELHAEMDGRLLRLTAAHDGGRRGVELPLSPSYGWTLLFAAGIEPGVPLRLMAALWLGALILPAAYWAASASHPTGSLGVVGAAVIAGLGLVPAVTGFPAVHWSEWLGAGSGAALGWALTRLAAYLQSRCGSPFTSAYSSS